MYNVNAHISGNIISFDQKQLDDIIRNHTKIIPILGRYESHPTYIKYLYEDSVQLGFPNNIPPGDDFFYTEATNMDNTPFYLKKYLIRETSGGPSDTYTFEPFPIIFGNNPDDLYRMLNNEIPNEKIYKIDGIPPTPKYDYKKIQESMEFIYKSDFNFGEYSVYYGELVKFNPNDLYHNITDGYIYRLVESEKTIEYMEYSPETFGTQPNLIISYHIDNTTISYNMSPSEPSLNPIGIIRINKKNKPTIDGQIGYYEITFSDIYETKQTIELTNPEDYLISFNTSTNSMLFKNAIINTTYNKTLNIPANTNKYVAIKEINPSTNKIILTNSSVYDYESIRNTIKMDVEQKINDATEDAPILKNITMKKREWVRLMEYDPSRSYEMKYIDYEAEL